jgi:cytochrome b
MSGQTESKQRIWDLPTRVFHWTLAISFFGAYLLSESERVRHFHIMFGYTVLALVAFRVVWGFIGTRYARFNSFAFGPRAVGKHVQGLLRRDGVHYVGHTPAGSWAIWAMLGLAVVTAGSGWLTLNEVGGEAFEEVHEVAANAWLFMVFVHVAGVIVSSLVERANLPRAMVTGFKNLKENVGSVRNMSVLGVLMLITVSTFWIAVPITNGSVVLPQGSEMSANAIRSRAHGGDDEHEDD